MTLRLRQIALVASDLGHAVDDLTSVFELGTPFNDPGVGVFGLRNAVFAVGTTFLEIVSPVREDASAARFLARKGGDAGYMVILQSDDLARERRRLDEVGVRIVFETALEDIATLHLHPHDIGGAIVSIDEARPPESWRWAGPQWERRARTERLQGIIGVEIACVDPARTASRWADVLGRPEPAVNGSTRTILLEEGTLVFSPCGQAADEGLTRVIAKVAAREPVLRSAEARHLRVASDEVSICRTWFRLTP